MPWRQFFSHLLCCSEYSKGLARFSRSRLSLLRDAVGMTRLLEPWENDWRATDHSSVPLLERNDRAILVGLTKEEDCDVS